MITVEPVTVPADGEAHNVLPGDSVDVLGVNAGDADPPTVVVWVKRDSTAEPKNLGAVRVLVGEGEIQPNWMYLGFINGGAFVFQEIPQEVKSPILRVGKVIADRPSPFFPGSPVMGG